MKLTIKRLLILTFIVVSGGFFGVGDAWANPNTVDFEAQAAQDYLAGEKNKMDAEIAISMCQEVATPCNGFDCTAGFEALIACMKQAEEVNAKIITTQAWQEYHAKVAADQAQAARRTALAMAFKGSLEMFSRTLARDLAVWVASGGRGQQPLFVTEGWGAYMKNIGDAALGDFIDGIGQTFGMDLCQPNFQFKLAVKIGLDQQQFEARCTFTEMMTNWQSAVSNANFAFEYQMSMRPGENDISYALIMADRRNSYVADALRDADKTLGIDGMWQPIKDIAGNILTPGSFIKEKFFESQSIQTATKGKDIFTGTAADFIEEFLNTLVAQLLQNLQIGFFGSGREEAERSSRDLPNLWDTLDRIGSLFNPFASPIVIGESGAKERFFNLTDSQIKVGGSYDILAKLAQCSDTAKTNPGPTDCVIDQGLLQAIRNRKYTQDLPEEIKNRLFAPQGANADNLETAIPYRSILILRKYRIIPVGWEIAAKMIQNMSADTAITLGEVLKAYENPNSPFYRLVEPYWLLKAPEVYCRRLGYGGHNELKDSQDGAISRSEYCADEQQCLREDSKGNCQAYGYCQEERRFWRIGTECDARYNTCQTYTARTGSTGSWLTNTLDFRYCNAQNAGCRSYATIFNYGSKEWNGDVNINGQVNRYSVISSDSAPYLNHPDYNYGYIGEGEYTNDNQRIRMLLPCSESSCDLLGNVCNWSAINKRCEICNWNETSKSCENNETACTIPAGEISCSLDNCDYDDIDIDNFDFEISADNQAFNVLDWTDERSYLNYNNRHYRAETFDRDNALGQSLHLTAVRNTKQLITTNIIEDLEPGNKYKLKFWLKGSISEGSVTIGVFSGPDTDAFYATYPVVKNLKSGELTSGSSFWRPVELVFDTESETLNTTNTKIAIITNAGSITDLYLDDFTLERTNDPTCLESGVKLFRIFETVASPANIHLDRDAQSCSAASEGCTEFIRPGQPADQSALYLKKAPAQFQCYGTPNATSTYSDVWPSDNANLLTALANRKPECSFFAQLCTLAEVGCELYRPVNGDPDVPGVISDNDRCPEVCVGYQVYKQEQTNFTNGSYRQFIADNNALYCSVGNVGCDEFTNLDKLGQEAEEKEYFSYFRRCQINNDPNYTDASAFYTWEGSDTTGYQLKSYNLKQSNQIDAGNDSAAPCTFLTYDTNGIGSCDDSTTETAVPGYCTQAEMLINSDCRQFYDSTGASHYRLLSKTIIVSNNCHPYRRTQTEAETAEAEDNCEANGGWWKDTSECVYMGDPDYSRACPASAKGCRAYTGNRGNNVRKVIESHFDGSNLVDLRWNTKTGLNITLSLEATFPGGYSLTNGWVAEGFIIQHPVKLTAGRSYTLSFWAKADGLITINGANSNINFVSTTVDNNYIANSDFRIVSTTNNNLTIFNPVITTDWQYYELGPVFINEDYDSAQLRFTIDDKKIYLDNVILKEITNNIYLVENSWFTPLSCDNLMTDPQGLTCTDNPSKRCYPGEHLGCSAYTDRSNTLHYLRSFTSLCRPDAVGCEALIDTFNYSSTSSITYNISDVAPGNSTFDKVDVPADREVYLVNNPRHQCLGEDKGCQALGLPLVDTSDRIYGYSTVFLKNNPDRYSTDLCRDGEVWCEEFAGNNSLNYFKDPRNKTCEYRDTGIEPGWYQTGTNQACVTTTNQTYGTGYAPPSEKVQPIGLVDTLTNQTRNDYNGWVGSCPPTQSSCSEYIDPLLVIYSRLDNTAISGYTFNLKPYTVYYSSVDLTNSALITTNTCGAGNIIKKDNSLLYYVNTNTDCTVGRNSDFYVTPIGTYYSLRDSVDYSSCNGLVDFREGCILVDDRSQMDYSTTSANYAGRFNYLTYKVNNTYWNNMALNTDFTRNTTLNPQAVAPYFIADDTANASKIVKAIPDRACNKWLYCTTYEKKDASDLSSNYSEYDTCLDVSSCSYTDKEGRCLTFADYSAPAVQNYDTNPKYYSNQTGYAMVGFPPNIPGYYKIHQMTQEGEGAYVPNSGFEDTFADTSEPIGWNSYDGVNPQIFEDVKQPTGWASYKFASISDSKNAPEGSSYLMVNTSYQVISEEVSVTPNTSYTMSFWYNTMNLEIPNAIPHLFVGVYKLNSVNGTMDYDNLSGDGYNSAYSFNVYPAGKDWVRQEITFNSGTNDKVIIVLKNCPNDDPNQCLYDPSSYDYGSHSVDTTLTNSCGDLNQNTACALSGHSLLDDIQIKPVLKANDDTNVARTCRVFPAKDAKSCAYWDNNNYYYGQYGYCLMTDPKNSKQCLQWYPVDNLKGEMAREISGYAGRAPLYYCIERATTTIDISHGAGGISINESALNEEWSGLASLETGRDVRFKEFDVDPEYQVFMRYPFVRFFTYTGGLVALAGKNARFRCPGGPLWAIMHPYGVMTGAGTVLCIDTDKDENQIIPIVPGKYISSDPEEAARFNADFELYQSSQGSLGRIYSDISNQLADVVNFFTNLITVGFAFVEGMINDWRGTEAGVSGGSNKFDSTKDGWGGWGLVHKPFAFGLSAQISDLKTIISPVTWSVADGEKSAIAALIGTALGTFLGEDVKTSGMMQMKIVTENDPSFGSSARDPITDLGGDVLGVAVRTDASQQENHFMTTIYGQLSTSFIVNYCKKFVRVVTSAGDNRALVGRANPGSGYILNETVAGFFGGPKNTDYFYFDPFNYDEFIADPDNYSSSDYAPFGSLVQPRNSNDPNSWDSRDGKPNKQPLYQEPPRTQGYSAPYQARMGELHTPEGIKNIFAKGYGTWEWKDFTADAKSGIYNGYYRSDADNWNLPELYCPPGDRGSTHCLMVPEVVGPSTFSTNNTVKLSFTTKVDSQQLPITGITIYWGDGKSTSYSGVAIRNRPNTSNPFTFYHVYNFDQIRSEVGTADSKISEPLWHTTKNVDNNFDMKITVAIQDNWGVNNSENISADKVAWPVDIMFLVDASGSMGWDENNAPVTPPTASPSRYSVMRPAIKNAIDKVYNNIPAARVGVTRFSNDDNSYTKVITNFPGCSSGFCPVSKQAEVTAVTTLDQLAPDGSTYIGSGVNLVKNQFVSLGSSNKKILILMADGGANDAAYAITQAYQIKTDNGVELYSFLFMDAAANSRLNMDTYSSNDASCNSRATACVTTTDCEYCSWTDNNETVDDIFDGIIENIMQGITVNNSVNVTITP